MKKSIISFLVTLFVLTTSFAAVKPLNLEPIEFDPIIQVDDFGTTFQLDSRMEIIGIICRLAEYPEFLNYYNGEDSYTVRIDKFFSKYKNHKAVKKAVELKNKGISSGAMISLSYYIKPDFSGTLVDFQEFPEGLNLLWKKIKTKDIFNFITLAHDFAVESNYTRISILHRADFIAQIGYFVSSSKKYHDTEFVKEFYNYPDNIKSIISVSMISPLCYFNHYTVDKENNTILYGTIYPGIYTFYYFQNLFSFESIPVANIIWDDVKDNFKKIYFSMSKKFISNENDYKKFEENYLPCSYYLAEQLTNFIILQFLKSPEYLESIKDEDNPLTYEMVFSVFEKELDGGFFYDGVKLFDEYSANRCLYPSLTDFAPKLVEFINSIEISEE